jgi:hypothetical protein
MFELCCWFTRRHGTPPISIDESAMYVPSHLLDFLRRARSLSVKISANAAWAYPFFRDDAIFNANQPEPSE